MDGLVRVHILADSDHPWTLSLRVPQWANDATLRVVAQDGSTDERVVQPGYAEVTRLFRTGDVVELDLPMAPRISRPDPRIDAVRGCVSIARGPEVLALESVDLTGLDADDVARIFIDDSAPPVERDGRTWVRVRVLDSTRTQWPYDEEAIDAAPPRSGEVALVAYHDWARRGPSTMRVWIPTT